MSRIMNDNELKWLACDLDGTLSKPLWPKDKIGIGKLMPHAKEVLEYMVSKGKRPVIYTARPWSHYQIIEEWIEKNDLPIHKIICGKPLFDKIIDDRNIEFKNWKQIKRRL